jgi:hypothetical protein
MGSVFGSKTRVIVHGYGQAISSPSRRILDTTVWRRMSRRRGEGVEESSINCDA